MVQSSHLRAQLFFCGVSKTTHMILAVHSVLHKGYKKMKRNVLHCYPLIWVEGWHIIDGKGQVKSFSFSRQHQTMRELLGATCIQLFFLVAQAANPPKHNAPASETDDKKTKAFDSCINNLYGSSVRMDLDPTAHRALTWWSSSNLDLPLKEWCTERLNQRTMVYVYDNDEESMKS